MSIALKLTNSDMNVSGVLLPFSLIILVILGASIIFILMPVSVSFLGIQGLCRRLLPDVCLGKCGS